MTPYIIIYSISIMMIQATIITLLMPVSPLILMVIWIALNNVIHFIVFNKGKLNLTDGSAPYNFTLIAHPLAKKYGIIQYCAYYLLAGWLLHNYTNWQETPDFLGDILLYFCLPVFIESIWGMRLMTKHPELFDEEPNKPIESNKEE